MIEFFSPEAERPFSSGVRVGNVLYLSGQIGMLEDGSMAEGFEAQARQTMENISAALKQAGSSIDRVFKATIMLDDMSRWAEFNSVYLEYFDPKQLPARSAFGTSGLVFGAHMEVECLAYVPE